MNLFTKRIGLILSKIQESFLEENLENKKMLDIYIKYVEGLATENEIKQANTQLSQVLKSIGLGILLVLPLSPITLPYIFSKAKLNNRKLKIR